jgi:hypothetical protein
MKLFDLPTDVLCKIFEFDDTYRLMYNRVLKEMLDINDVLASLILETDPIFGRSQNLENCFYTVADAFTKSQLTAAYRVHVRRALPKRGSTKAAMVERLYWKLYPVIQPLHYRENANTVEIIVDSDSDSDDSI